MDKKTKKSLKNKVAYSEIAVCHHENFITNEDILRAGREYTRRRIDPLYTTGLKHKLLQWEYRGFGTTDEPIDFGVSVE